MSYAACLFRPTWVTLRKTTLIRLTKKLKAHGMHRPPEQQSNAKQSARAKFNILNDAIENSTIF